MTLALKELWRAKLRFGLLAGAIALLVFLLLFLNTLSSALVGTFVGALRQLDADVLVYGEDARRTLAASRLDPALAGEIAGVEGVADAAGLGVATLATEVDGQELDLTLFGVDMGGAGAPTRLVEGRLPGPGEMVVDRLDAEEGLTLGTAVRLVPGDRSLTVVGYTDQARFAVGPTGWTTLEEWEEVVRSGNPAAPAVPVNAVAVRGKGTDPAALAERIGAEVGGVEALDLDTAVASTPGVDAVGQSFGLITGITFVVVVLLVGFFFLILTVQKLRTFTALRAVGASPGYLGRALLLQIGVVVLAAVAIAVGFLLAALAAIPLGLPATADPALAARVLAAVLGASILAGLVSVARIRRLNPADVA